MSENKHQHAGETKVNSELPSQPTASEWRSKPPPYTPNAAATTYGINPQIELEDNLSGKVSVNVTTDQGP